MSLTSIDVRAYDVGQHAVRTLLTRIEDPSRDASEHLVTPTLEIRNSTAQPADHY